MKRSLFLLTMLVLLPACWTDKGGTHRLIVGVGIGIITTTNRPGVDVLNSRILGGEFSSDGLGVGLVSHQSVQIDPVLASNVVISVKSSPGKIVITNYPVNFNTNPQTKSIKANQP